MGKPDGARKSRTHEWDAPKSRPALDDHVRNDGDAEPCLDEPEDRVELPTFDGNLRFDSFPSTGCERYFTHVVALPEHDHRITGEVSHTERPGADRPIVAARGHDEPLYVQIVQDRTPLYSAVADRKSVV